MIDRSIVKKGELVMYILSEGWSGRGFVREELTTVPRDTELPHDYLFLYLADNLFDLGSCFYFFNLGNLVHKM